MLADIWLMGQFFSAELHFREVLQINMDSVPVFWMSEEAYMWVSRIRMEPNPWINVLVYPKQWGNKEADEMSSVYKKYTWKNSRQPGRIIDNCMQRKYWTVWYVSPMIKTIIVFTCHAKTYHHWMQLSKFLKDAYYVLSCIYFIIFVNSLDPTC